MNSREKIGDIDQKVDDLTNQSTEIWKEVRRLSDLKAEILAEVIIKEKLLSLVTWEFDNEFYLICTSDRWDKKMRAIIELLDPSDNSKYAIGLRCRLCFDDGKVYLHFDDLQAMEEMVKSAGLTISFNAVQSKIDTLENKLSILVSMISMRDKFEEIINSHL